MHVTVFFNIPHNRKSSASGKMT